MPVWNTLQDHLDLINSPIYPKLQAAIGGCIDGPLNLFHVPFEPTAALGGIFSAPVTALAPITKLQPGKTGEDLAATMALLTGAKDVKGCYGAAWGKKVEHDEWAFVTAWDSPEVSAPVDELVPC